MFENEYEPDSILQAMWDLNNSGGCLCTMRESCGWCDYDSIRHRKEVDTKILQLSKDSGYQLYLSNGKKKVDFEYVTKTYDLK